MDLPYEAKEWSEADLGLFAPTERKTVVLRKLESDEETMKEVLHTKEDWDKWFNRAPGVSPSWEMLLPGLYVVLCSRAAPVLGKQAPARYISFEKSTWARLTREFHVHREITRAISRDVTSFTSLAHHDKASKKLKISFTVRMAETLPNDLAMSSTYIPSTGSSFTIVYGCTDDHMERIIDRLQAPNEQLGHLFLMPGIFVELERERVVDAVEDLLDNFTLKSDHLESTPWDPKSDADGKETQKYLSLCLRSRNIIDHIQASKRQLLKVLEEMDEVLEANERTRDDSERGGTSWKIGLKMKKRMQDIVREYDDKIDECNMVICNTSLAMQTVWNHIVRKDSSTNTEISQANRAIALETRHESAQMRTIAILTMFYLPLSSVAAIFSMDMFNWEAGIGESVVSEHIWLFAVLSVGLTLLTLVAWRLGTNRERRMRENKYFNAPRRQNSLV